MAFISELTAISENTSGYSVKVAESSYSNYGTSTFSQSDYYTNTNWQTYNSSSGSSFYSDTGTYSACYTQTYQSNSTYSSFTESGAGLFNEGPFNTPPQTNLTYTNSGLGSTSNYVRTIKSYGQYGYSIQSEYSVSFNGQSFSNLTSQIFLYFTSTNTDSETIWTYRGSQTILAQNSNGITSNTTTYNQAPDGATSFVYLSTTTTQTIDCNESSSTQATWQVVIDDFNMSETYESLYNVVSNKTVSGVKTFYTTDLTLVGSGPKSYSHMLICSYDKTGNIIFTARTESGESIRDSNRNFLLGASDTASLSKSDVILSSFNAGQTTGNSTSYVLTTNNTFTAPATITKTTNIVNLVSYINGEPIVQYSTSSYTQNGTSYNTSSGTQGFTYQNTPLTFNNITQGSFLSTSCRQMVYTTSTHKKFLFYDTITQSFDLTSYIFTTSSYTRHENFPIFGSTTNSGFGTASYTNSTINSDSTFTQTTTASGSSSSQSRSGTSVNTIAQTITTFLAALSTRFRDPWNNTEYVSTYYTEALNAGIFINKERKAFFGYSPSSASLAAFYDRTYSEYTIPPYLPFRPTLNLFPFAGSFTLGDTAVSSTSSINQTYSESPSSTAFSQTVSYSVGTSISTSTRTIGYSLSGYSTLATSQQIDMAVDDQMYFWYDKNYPYGNGVPQVYPTASNILNSFGYFASNGSYYLNDNIFVNTTGSSPVVQYIDGSQTFAYPISKNSLPEDYYFVYYLDHGRYTADSIVSGAQAYGNYDLFGGFIGGEIQLVFSYSYGI